MPKKPKEGIPVQILFTPNYIINTCKILNKISPFLASRLAARLFVTPFRYKLPKREKEMDDRSIQQDLYIPAIDKKVVVYSYGNPLSRKKILLVHGWSGRGTQLSAIAQEFIGIGFHVLSFDAPAHGKSPGKTSMMPHFIEAVHEMQKQYGTFEAAIGHSLGGMSLLRAVKENLEIKKLVIIGTANSVTNITREFAENLHLDQKVADKMKAYFDKKFGEDMDNYSGAYSAKEVKIPTLVVHDKLDVDVKIHCAYEILEQLEKGSSYITEGLGHRKILGDKKVINTITTFVTV